MKTGIFHRRPAGFTLIELMISVSILTLLTVMSGRIYLNYLNNSRDLKAGNLVYEEARFLMEKIVREVRQNAIDYEQYFNRNVMTPYNTAMSGEIGTYADNYCSYSAFFYDNGPDDDFSTLEDNESRGSKNPDRANEILLAGITDPPIPLDADLNPAAVRTIENELYLINISGTKRTILTRVEKEVEGETIGKMAMLKMVGKDFGSDHIDGRNPDNEDPPVTDINCAPDKGENDGLIDTWFCETDYPCKHDQLITSTSPGLELCEGLTDLPLNDKDDPNHSFVDISPNALNVVDLKFIIAPQDDPWKSYAFNPVQFQPHVTIQLTVEANPKLAGTTGNRLPNITLTSTVTLRNYDEIKSDCHQ